MPGPSLAELRQGVATALADLHEKLTVYPRGTGAECTPAILVVPQSGPRKTANPCRCETDVVLGVYVGFSDREGGYEGAQRYLDELLSTAGPHSIRERLADHRALGGVAHRADVRQFQGYGVARFNTQDAANTWSAQVLLTIAHEC